MKREDNLMGVICSMENLIEADKQARIGKTHRNGIDWFDKNREENLLELQRTMREGTYKTSKYNFFSIFEPKERKIASLPYYPDRICHHAVMRVVEQIFVPYYIKQTYSCIKGRGLHAGVTAVKEALKDVEGTKYCLKFDIRHFYPSIDHEILKSIIRRKIGDERVLVLMDEWIDSYDSGETEGAIGDGRKGIPIGNYPSQHFANLYLTPFDHWMKEVKKVKYYFRYADDITIFGNDKERLRRLFFEIRDYIEGKMLLRIKSNWQIFPVDARGVDFLGYVFYHTHTKIRKKVKQNIKKKVVSCAKKGMSAKEIHKAVGSYQGWLNYGNTRNLIHKLNTIGNGKVFK